MDGLLEGKLIGTVTGFNQASDGTGYYMKVKSSIPGGVRLSNKRQPGTFTIRVDNHNFRPVGFGETTVFEVTAYVDCNIPQQQNGQDQQMNRLYDTTRFLCTKMYAHHQSSTQEKAKAS